MRIILKILAAIAAVVLIAIGAILNFLTIFINIICIIFAAICFLVFAIAAISLVTGWITEGSAFVMAVALASGVASIFIPKGLVWLAAASTGAAVYLFAFITTPKRLS